jgi:endonuclease G, mitochondrial
MGNRVRGGGCSPRMLATGATAAVTAAAVAAAITAVLVDSDDTCSLSTTHTNTTSCDDKYFPKSSFFGMSPTMPFRHIAPNEHLEICFDTRTRVPLYVIERLTAQTLGERGSSFRRHRPNFYEDRVAVPESNFRSTLAHYKGSGYDRGHLAPAADFPSTSQDTFTLCNIVPQDHIMNVTIWNSLEEWIRRVCREKTTTTTTGDSDNGYNEMYVVTGPLWLPRRKLLNNTAVDNLFEYQYHGLGRPPALVAVPTHLFKVVVLVDKRRNVITHFACFVVHNFDDGNHDDNGNSKKKKKLEDFLVLWTDLETVSGLQFFPTLTNAIPEWKEHADRIVRHQLLLRDKDRNRTKNNRSNAGGTLPLLLLTDGGGKDTVSYQTAEKQLQKKIRGNTVDLRHLCVDGKCQ